MKKKIKLADAIEGKASLERFIIQELVREACKAFKKEMKQWEHNVLYGTGEKMPTGFIKTFKRRTLNGERCKKLQKDDL